jgi:predicted Zn-dependent protease
MGRDVAATYFPPGPPSAGRPARVRLSGGYLRVDTEAGREDVATHLLSFKNGGFDGRQWFLEWPAENGRGSLGLADAETVRALLADAPVEVTRRFEASLAGQARLERRSRIGLALLAVLCLLPVALLGLAWFKADAIAAWMADRVSLEHEQVLGDLAFSQIRPGLKPRPEGPAPALVRDLGARLTAGSRYHYQWLVADSPEVNAFALPGGHVVVYTGLLKAADSPEEVAGVLAHEVQHVERRHALRNLIHALGWHAVFALFLGDASGSVWADAADRLINLGYSRDLEREADMGGLRLLRQAGIAPDGMPSFFEKLAQREGPGIPLLASHPTTTERLASLRQAIAAQSVYPARAIDADWARLRAGL